MDITQDGICHDLNRLFMGRYTCNADGEYSIKKMDLTIKAHIYYLDKE